MQYNKQKSSSINKKINDQTVWGYVHIHNFLLRLMFYKTFLILYEDADVRDGSGELFLMSMIFVHQYDQIN